jgi:hypothetical protein
MPTIIEMSSTDDTPSTRDRTKPSRVLNGSEKTSTPLTGFGIRAATPHSMQTVSTITP